ncbi:hypothetical protein [Halobaculum gomorrense]|nr:hypothetical protein [Halobaculum gomorrense]
MNRRTFLGAVAGGGALLGGGVAVADATRADIAADPELRRARGAPITTEQAVSRESVEYRPESDTVRYSDTVEPFERWAERACAAVGAKAVLPAIDRRIDGAGDSLDGVGRGVRHLAFGTVITVDHTVVADPDGTARREPTVRFADLVAVAPRSMRSTVSLAGREHTRRVPVAVGRRRIAPL